jgi:quinol monooxygenase YgiN
VVALARVYRMSCLPGRREELRDALEALATVLKNIEGLQSVSLLRDAEQEDDFVFIERWASAQLHETAKPLIPKQAFARVTATLAAKPCGQFFEYVFEA